jgi:diguanylate cyclase (GGDEF)-like protein
MDLDHFKGVNDTLGHQAGDRFLKEVAARWAEQLRGHDILARYGGDEFAVVLPRCSVDAGAEVADRLRAALPGGHTCSIGLAQWNGIEGSDELQRRADEALYRAKEAGRNCVVSASDGAMPVALARSAAPTEAET